MITGQILPPSNKIFIIGLPRTATTSLCLAFLELGYKTAHTAYTYSSFKQAQVIADTPIFSDYQQLDEIYPNSLFIYLERDLATWLPSIKQLLNRMAGNLLRTDGGFNPIIKRCFSQTFAPFTPDNIQTDDFLTQCYLSHQSQVLSYFKHKQHHLLRLNIAKPDSYQQLLHFLQQHQLPAESPATGFTAINIAGKVTAWNQIKHPLKVASTRSGKIDKLDYLKLFA